MSGAMVDLVTGGAGFIGSHLTDRLLGLGRSVRVIDNMAVGKPRNLQHHSGNPKLEVRVADVSDPAAMAELVRYWTGTRPTTLTGIIWYRLPTERDVLNWRWPTLAAVMQGRTPSPKLAAELRRPEAGLVEVELTNTGDADHAGVATVALRWQAGTLLASDALGGFTKVDAVPRSLQLHAQGQSLRLAPGERRTIGWLRFKAHADVETQILPP